jgi:intein-encoded DNA endonuclease-like protein
MKKITKWTKCFVVEIQNEGQWKIMTKPVTELQAIRLMLQERILRRFYDRNEARVIKVSV